MKNNTMKLIIFSLLGLFLIFISSVLVIVGALNESIVSIIIGMGFLVAGIIIVIVQLVLYVKQKKI